MFILMFRLHDQYNFSKYKYLCTFAASLLWHGVAAAAAAADGPVPCVDGLFTEVRRCLRVYECVCVCVCSMTAAAHQNFVDEI